MSAPRMNAGFVGAPESTAASEANPDPLSGRPPSPVLDPELDAEPAPELDPETTPDTASLTAPELEASELVPEPDAGPEIDPELGI
jgi:hypothetical protein